jgi:hypothetical protein
MDLHVAPSYDDNWWAGLSMSDIHFTKGTPQEALDALYAWVKHQAEEFRIATEHGRGWYGESKKEPEEISEEETLTLSWGQEIGKICFNKDVDVWVAYDDYRRPVVLRPDAGHWNVEYERFKVSAYTPQAAINALHDELKSIDWTFSWWRPQ